MSNKISRELYERFEAISDRVQVNSNGSVSFISQTEKELPDDTKSSALKVSTPVLTIRTSTTVTTKSSESVSTVTTIKPSSNAAKFLADLQKAQVKLKSFTSFGQIAVNIGFNCAIKWPPMFNKILSSFSFLNLDIAVEIFPAFNLGCHFRPDYIAQTVS